MRTEQPIILARLWVGGARVDLSKHAAVRYAERVRPGLPAHRCAEELKRMAALRLSGLRLSTQPAWVRDPEEGRLEPLPEAWLLVGDDVALPVVNGVAVTCLTRGSLSERSRAGRAAHRARKAAARAAKRGTQGGKAGDYRPPSRRPGPLPEIGS